MNHFRTLALAALLTPLLLAGCASSGGQPSAVYDFGPALPLAQPATTPPIPALIVADLSGPAALDTERMVYRLLYADARQARPYAYHQWTSSPLQLLTQRLKTRLAQAGIKVLSTTDAAASLPLLRIEVDDFAQHFDRASHSSGQIALRASVFRGHQLLDQRSFQRSSPAPTPDAAGGAHALADSSDALAADLLTWLATLPPERRPQ
ncbi:MAG: ABC-type transport auxiliary lipoprotein family protein [Sphingomonadaceae bacterium]